MKLKNIITYALLSCIVLSSVDIAGAVGDAVEKTERKEEARQQKVDVTASLITNWLNARKKQYVQAGVNELVAIKLVIDDFHDLKVRLDKGDQEVSNEFLNFAETGKISLPLRPPQEVDFATLKQSWVFDRTVAYVQQRGYHYYTAQRRAEEDFLDLMRKVEKGEPEATNELERYLKSRWWVLKKR